jgi:hypothetical protein
MSRRYVDTNTALGYESGDAWLRFDVGTEAVFVDKFCDVPLNPVQCEILAEWLVRAADDIRSRTTKCVKR